MFLISGCIKNVMYFFLSTDMQQIAMGSMVESVALTRFTARTLDFYEAKKLCKLVNASMASYDQLYTAWSAGLSVCV